MKGKIKNQWIFFCHVCLLLWGFSLTSSLHAASNQHPCLLLTAEGVKEIKASNGKYPDFDRSAEDILRQARLAMQEGIEIPVPVDGGGGYTHEKHKDNYYAMFHAGISYQLTGDKEYAAFVKEMLYGYAKLYPTLSLHPASRSATPGRLFWQALNECVWLVHTANAYDCIYETLTEEERRHIEDKLFRPMALFIMKGNKNNEHTFNKMHNHATWATASVGMIGYVMGDKELQQCALYGSDKSGKGGFLKQLVELFSPDGYYAEGAYYQRYALWPFVTFAQAIHNCEPSVGIFEMRNNILEKALSSLLNQAYNGQLFYLNDALDKTYHTQEIIYASNILFGANTKNESLLDIIAFQKKFLVSDAGFSAAKAAAQRVAKPVAFKSVFLRDGANGDRGGLAILRMGEGDKQTCLTFKATSHGLSHGHFDKLSITFFDNGNPIVQDYGSARFLNLVTKFGGHYTPENKTWAKQTIAHNTVTVDEISHFKGDMDESEKYHPEIRFYDDSNPDIQIVSAVDRHAAPGVDMIRTVAMVKREKSDYPFIIDCFTLRSEAQHTYDLPCHYVGQSVNYNFPVTRNCTERKPLGAANGYQHLWLTASVRNDNPYHAFTWVNADRFYTITTINNPADQILLAQIGANDPNEHLRNDPAYIIRRSGVKNTSFVSVIEPHGNYDLVREVTSGYMPALSQLQVVMENSEYMVLRIAFANEDPYMLLLSVNPKKGSHQLKVENALYEWDGNYLWTKEKR